MTDFFISRNKADKDWAQWVAWQLEAAGYTTLIQDWDFGPGDNFVLKMQEAVSHSKKTIAIVSPDFLRSAFTAPEWAAAFAKDPTGAKRKLVPVRVRMCEPDGLLDQVVRIDLVDLDEAAATSALLSGVMQQRAKPSVPPPFPGNSSSSPPKFPGEPSSSKLGPSNPKPRSSGTTTSNLSMERAKSLIDQHHWGADQNRGKGRTGDVWLGAVIVPERQSGPYLDVLKLSDSALHDQIAGMALTGASAIFSRARSTREFEQADHLRFEQTDEHSRSVVALLQTYTNGVLVFRSVVDRPASRGTISLAGSSIIDEEAVQKALTAFVEFASCFYEQRRRDPGNLYLGVSLGNLSSKQFGRLPDYPLTRLTLGDPRINDPLRVPVEPLKVTPAQVAKPVEVAKTIVDHIARVFRLENAYFKP